MSDFPNLSIPPDFPVEEVPEKTGLVSNSEYGYVHGRKKYTLQRKRFRIKYSALPNSDKALLESHFEEVDIAVAFNWTHPLSQETIQVRYVDAPEFKWVAPDCWEVHFELLST